MQYDFVLIRTRKGGRYARKILNSIRWVNENRYPQHDFITTDMTIGQFSENFDDGMFGVNRRIFNPRNTIIHARCANPRTEWTIKLRKLEESGYKVVNSVDCIELTSNKLACSLHLRGRVDHPRSWEYRRDMNDYQYLMLMNDIGRSGVGQDFLIAKPLTSLEQGANVRKIDMSILSMEEVREEFNKVPGSKIVVQEYIPYTALHRVIVIGGRALPYTFVDRPEWHEEGDWKVSCCLNRTSMIISPMDNPVLRKLAEDTQRAVNGVINFIDIFEYPDANGNTTYTNAEINTACSLNIHERLAREAGRTDWNIHYRIAKQLITELGV